MSIRAAALLPLGSERGPEALDVWEHIALSEWLEHHPLPGHELLERQRQYAFEQELLFWEGVTYSSPQHLSIWDADDVSEPEEGAWSMDDVSMAELY